MSPLTIFSVVIPTHDRAALVQRAHRSVVNQRTSDFEIIIVNDGSTDSTPQVLGALRSDPAIKGRETSTI